MISTGIEEAKALRNRWEEAYQWLPQREGEGLFGFAETSINYGRKTFQEPLEQAAFALSLNSEIPAKISI